MKDKDLVYFKNILEIQLEELQSRGNKTIADLLNSEGGEIEYLDMAARESEHSYKLKLRTREKLLVGKIQQSLEDIENGEYGICIKCEEVISLERLLVRPVARLCIDCKNKQEQGERVAGL